MKIVMGPRFDPCGKPEIHGVQLSDVGQARHTASGLIGITQSSQKPLLQCRNRNGGDAVVWSGL